MSGYEVYFDAYSPNFIRRKNMGFSVGLAWCFGRIKITQTDISGISAFSNPYFTPVLQTEGHILLFNRLHTGIRYMYRVDASKTGWKRKSGNAPDLPGTRLSGGSGSMFLAWAF